MKTRSDDLEILLAVVDSGSFSAAAESLGIQVARVSRGVTRLEQQLQTTLLNRTTRRLEVTEEGQRFIQGVRNGLQQLQLAEEQLELDDQPPSGRLRVDAASPFALHQLVPLAHEFSQHYPSIQLELTAHEGFIDLLEHRTDIAIRIGTLEDSKLHARLLGMSPLLLVASPAYLSRFGEPDTPQQLAQHQLLRFVGSRRLNQWPVVNPPEIAGAISASNGEVIRQLALAGNGIACLSRFMVQKDIEQGQLQTILDDFLIAVPEREPVHAVYYRSSRVSRRIQVFLDFIQSRLSL